MESLNQPGQIEFLVDPLATKQVKLRQGGTVTKGISSFSCKPYVQFSSSFQVKSLVQLYFIRGKTFFFELQRKIPALNYQFI